MDTIWWDTPVHAFNRTTTRLTIVSLGWRLMLLFLSLSSSLTVSLRRWRQLRFKWSYSTLLACAEPSNSPGTCQHCRLVITAANSSIGRSVKCILNSKKALRFIIHNIRTGTYCTTVPYYNSVLCTRVCTVSMYVCRVEIWNQVACFLGWQDEHWEHPVLSDLLRSYSESWSRTQWCDLF